MEKEFIPYEQALELKELGFDEPCIAFYEPHNEEVMIVGVPQRYNDPSLLYVTDFCAPPYSQAFRWFRDKYGINVSISINWEEGIGKDSSYGKYACSLQHKSYDESIREFIGVFEKYEKAELKCLKQLIEMVKSK